MNTSKGINFLVGLVFLSLIISSILFVINLILSLWVNDTIFLDFQVYIGLIIVLFIFEIIRIMIMFMIGFFTITIKRIDIKIKVTILVSLIIGIGLNFIFLIRLFGFACFAPVYSFSCLPFVSIPFVFVVVQEYDIDLG